MKNVWCIVFMFALAGCREEHSSQWTLWIYPEGKMLNYQKITKLENYDDCREAALNIISLLPTKSVAMFECGYKCKEQVSHNLGLKPISICAETRDD